MSDEEARHWDRIAVWLTGIAVFMFIIPAIPVSCTGSRSTSSLLAIAKRENPHRPRWPAGAFLFRPHGPTHHRSTMITSQTHQMG